MNEYTSRIVEAPEMKTNQDETARPPVMRYKFRTEDSAFFNENGKPDNAILNAATERPGLANFQILPPKRTEFFEFPAMCNRTPHPAELTAYGKYAK